MAFALGTIPRWEFLDKAGLPNAGGKITFYRSVAKDQKKAVYQDENGLIPYDNPLTLDSIGGVGLIYFNDDEPYYIVCRDSTDKQKIWEDDNYVPAGGGGGGGGVTEMDYLNYVINGQFLFFDDASISTLPASETAIADYWYFDKNNTSATDSIDFINFALGSTTPPLSPKYYLHYACTNVPIGETYKDVYIKIKGVESFQGSPIVLAIEQQGTVPVQVLEFRYLQHFGTGGAPSADVGASISSHNVSLTWSKINDTLTLPTISGKTLGTNNDDYIAFIIRLPVNVTTEIDLTNFQINLGSAVLDYEYLTYDQQYIKKRALELPLALNPPSYYISGAYLTWNAVNNITISSGNCTDVGSNDLFTVPSITKFSDSTWVEGDGNGGFPDTIVIALDTWYHVFAIMKVDIDKFGNRTNTVDVGFDSAVDASNLLADTNVVAAEYTYYRRIGSIKTLTTGTEIREFTQRQDLTLYQEDFFAYNTGSFVGDGSGSIIVDVPADITTDCFCNCRLHSSGADGIYATFYYTFLPYPAYPYACNVGGSDGNEFCGDQQLTTSTQTVDYYISDAGGASTNTLRVVSIGYKDYRLT